MQKKVLLLQTFTRLTFKLNLKLVEVHKSMKLLIYRSSSIYDGMRKADSS